MAVTRSYSGSLRVEPFFQQTTSGDSGAGPTTPNLKWLQTWYDDGSTDPNLSGWLYGALTIGAGGDILLAAASDPLGSFGDALHSDGLTASGKKLKLLYLRNTHATASFKLVQKNTNGLLLFDKVTGVTLTAGGVYLWEDPGGDLLGALTTGASDGLTVSLPGAASTGILLAVFGT